MDQVEENFKELRNTADKLETKVRTIYKDIEERVKFYKNVDTKIEEISKSDQVVTLNVGGKKYKLKLSSLLKFKDTFFYGLFTKLIEKDFDFVNKEIFIDRGYEFFDYVIETLLYQHTSYGKVNPKNTKAINQEIEYYKVLSKVAKLSNQVTADIIKVTSTMNSSDLGEGIFDSPENESGGTVVTGNQSLIFELSDSLNIASIFLKGTSQNSFYGKGAKIAISNDGYTYVNIGKIPKNYGKNGTTITCSSNYGKFVKITANSNGFGLSYIQFIKKNDPKV
jgi:hypothetical protein